MRSYKVAERRRFVTKKAADILESVFNGYTEAGYLGHAQAHKYLISFINKFNSIPDSVKFFLYDLLAEESYHTGNTETAAEAVSMAERYLPAARSETSRQFTEYLPKLRFLERGIGFFTELGEYEKALALCDQAISLDLGKSYESKRRSIERMT